MPYSVYESICSDQSFPVHVFVTTIQSSAFHWHHEYEMIGVLKGSLIIQIQSEVITLQKGDVCLLNPNTIHALKESGQEENLCMFIQISRDLFSFEKNGSADVRFYLCSPTEDAPACGYFYFYRRMAELVLESLSDHRHRQLRMRAQVCTLIADLFDYTVYDVRFQDSAAENGQEHAVKIIEYFQEHIEDDHVTDAACHCFGFSRKSLDRILKATIGISGKSLLESLRIEKAKKLLKHTDKNMNYILDICGFGSEKTFYRVFRRETGLTPMEFRLKGSVENYSDTVKGYLNYELSDAVRLLQQILEEREDA